MKRIWLIGIALLAACAPATREPKVCPPEANTPILSSSTSPDTDPDTFCFSDVVNAEPDPVIPVYSNTITVRGINQPAPITATSGTTVFVNDQYLEYFSDTPSSKTVKAGDKIKVAVSASNQRGVTQTTVVRIGAISSSFSVTTKP